MKAELAQQLDAADLKPNEEVGVIDDSHLVGFGIAHTDSGLENGHELNFSVANGAGRLVRATAKGVPYPAGNARYGTPKLQRPKVAYGLSLEKIWSFEMSLNMTKAAKISSTTKAAW